VRLVKAALVIGGGPKWPDGDKLKRAGVTRLYYEANNPEVDAAFMQQLRDWGYEAGVMRDPNWNNYTDTPEQFVAKVNDDISRLAPKKPDGSRPPLAVMLDIERHDSDYVTRALREFDRTNSGRNYVWTMEYHQAGWFSSELVDHVNGDPQCRLVPQLYYGDMGQVIDSHAAARDLASVGVHDDRVCFFYNLRYPPLPIDWDGCLYLENWTQLP
jgi:hypothetical protein